MPRNAPKSAAAARKKVVHHLDMPFSTTAWPEISMDAQDAILELLCRLLNPLGQNRRAYTVTSKRKRPARNRLVYDSDGCATNIAPSEPRPELCSKVDVGFSSITRNLMNHSRSGEGYYSMVFVVRGNQSSAFNCHFPIMVAAASQHAQAVEKTRLVGFSKSCSDRLSACLGIPRASSIAVARDAPGTAALWELVQKTVAPVKLAWLDPVIDSKYTPLKIISEETVVGSKRAKTR